MFFSSNPFCVPLVSFFPDVTEQMKEAGLCVFNNNWYQIYDFNAFEGDDSHWTLLPELDLSSFVTEASKYIALSCEASLSLIPKTFGHKNSKDYSCLVVIFPNGTEGKRSRKLIDRVSQRSVSVIHLFFFSNVIPLSCFWKKKTTS